MQKITHFQQTLVAALIRYRVWLFLLAVPITLACVAPASRMVFDRSIENMFAADDPLLGPYRDTRRRFGAGEIAVVAYVDPDLLTADGLTRLDQLSAQLVEVPGVERVISLSSAGLNELLLALPVGEAMLDLMTGYLIGEDRQTAAIICVLEAETEGAASQSDIRTDAIAELRRLVVAHDPSGVVAGEPVMVVDGFANIEHDGVVLGWTSTVLMSLTLLLCFGRLRWIVVPLVVVNVTLLWTRALLVVADLKLSMVSSMLWAIVTVIGVAMVVHVIVRFRDSLAEGLSPTDALLTAARQLAAPIALSCATDALAFGALLRARVGPVQDFGKMMAIGSLLAMASVAVVAPTLILLGQRARPRDIRDEDDRLRQLVARLLDMVERRPKLIAVVSLMMLVVALAGYPRLRVESDFTRNFRADSEIATSYQFVEEQLGGAGVWEVMLPAPGELNWDYFRKVRVLEERLRTEVVVVDAAGNEQPGLTKVLGAVDVFDAILGPLAERLPAAMVMDRIEVMMPGVAQLFRGREPDVPDETYQRILLRARERQSSEQKAKLIADVNRICHEEFTEAEVTGFFVLLASLIDSMLRDQWVTFAIAVALIGGMMWAGLGRLRLALVALVPNALPIIVVMGTIAWFGVSINMGAAMVAAVSMGLSIDSTTHLMVEYRRGRDAGLSTSAAIAAAHTAVGPAILLSTLALVVGFSVLCLSQFVPTIYFGVLVSLSMIGGMACNLLLLPVLLRWVER